MIARFRNPQWLAAFCLFSLAVRQVSAQPYRNASLSADQRVEDLIARMTLEEKVAQMRAIWQDKSKFMDDQGRFVPEKAEQVIPHGIGQVTRPSDRMGQRNAPRQLRDPRETVEFVNAVQRFLRDKTRLGIPALFHEEGLHGYSALHATHFPQAIALAGTFDPELVETVYTLVAREIRARGVHHVLSPVVDVARDPRWGRIEETYGEDPYLASQIGLAAVRGFQGRSLPLAEERVLVTLKHMTGHGQPESGENIAPAHVTQRMLWEIFLPPFALAVKEGYALSVMASYNEIDGVPSHVNTKLLKDILRDTWGFNGFIVADYNGIDDLIRRHHVAEDFDSAAVQALRTGVDVDLPNGDAYGRLVDLVRQGRVGENYVDQSVRRHLRAKFISGVFENPFADPDYADRITGNAEARALALRAAERSIVLLKNENNLLPLRPGAHNRIAVIGPNAGKTVLGGYSNVPRQTVSIVEGIRDRVGDAAEVFYAEGVRLVEGDNPNANEVVLADPGENRQRIQEAVRVANTADIIVLVVGGNERTSREGWAENHLGDRTSLQMVGEQAELFDAMVATGKPVVVVLIHGRPLAVTEIVQKAPAILDGWYLGQEEGIAVAKAIFGDINPGAKLPVTVPRSVGYIPMYYNHKPSAWRGYLFDTTEPLFPFGYGLSYTTFKFENLRLDRNRIDLKGSVNVSVDVTNTGTRRGDEVVQLYIRDEVSSVTRPVKELKGFKRVTLQPGEKTTVTLPINQRDLSDHGWPQFGGAPIHDANRCNELNFLPPRSERPASMASSLTWHSSVLRCLVKEGPG